MRSFRSYSRKPSLQTARQTARGETRRYLFAGKGIPRGMRPRADCLGGHMTLAKWNSTPDGRKSCSSRFESRRFHWRAAERGRILCSPGDSVD
jgi:hypothetical protein